MENNIRGERSKAIELFSFEETKDGAMGFLRLYRNGKIVTDASTLIHAIIFVLTENAKTDEKDGDSDETN